MNMQLNMRIAVERMIVTQVVTDCLAAGYELEADADGETIQASCTDKEALLENLFDVDIARLYLYRPGRDAFAVGWVLFVFGNDGPDVISDYTTGLDELGVLKKANELADAAEDGSLLTTLLQKAAVLDHIATQIPVLRENAKACRVAVRRTKEPYALKREAETLEGVANYLENALAGEYTKEEVKA